MNVKRLIKQAFGMAGFSLERLPAGRSIYDQDGLWTVHNHEFVDDPRFKAAYRRGVAAALGLEYLGPWRMHIGLWAAGHALSLEGDFVECGVNRGVMTTAIMQYHDWNTRNRRFFLLDTFAGLDVGQLTDGERERGAINANREYLGTGRYVTGVESVRENFAGWNGVNIVVGRIPDTLSQVDAEKVSYLHLDMNCMRPEVEALEHFWPRLVPGAIVLCDDYAFEGYHEQKIGLDAFARAHDVGIAALPTGQGLLLKPPNR